MRPLPLLLIAGSVSLASSVYAQRADDPTAVVVEAPPSSPSEAAIARGVALRRRRRDADALAEFRAAYALDPSPRALAQIALAEAALERWVLAEVDLTRALATSDPWLEENRAVLVHALGTIQSQLGTLDLAGDDGAEVWVDGALAGHLPTPALRVVAKPDLVVELRAPGFVPAKHTIAVKGGEVAHARWTLVRAPEPPPPAPAPALAPAAPGAHEDRSPPTLAWIAAGGAVALVAGGAASTVIASNAATDYDSPACGSRPSVTCAGDASRVHAAEAFEVVGYGGAGAAAVVSAILFLAAPHAPSSASALRCEPAAGGARCGLVF